MQKNQPPCNLRNCFLCRHTSEGERQQTGLHRQNLTFKKGEVLFREGEPVKGVYFVYSGSAKVHKQWENDKQLIIRFAAQGAIMGHRGLGSKLIYTVSATALEPLVVCFVELDHFRELMRSNGHLCYDLLVQFAEELENAEQKMRDLALMPVKGRIAQALLRLEEQFGTNRQGAIDFRIAWNDLAAFTATTYETVFRTLKGMIGEGLLEVNRKVITLNDRKRLQDLVNGPFIS